MRKPKNNSQDWTGPDAVKFVKFKAKELGLPIGVFLRRVRVSRTTYWRWKNELVTPNDDKMLSILTIANGILGNLKASAR